MNKTTIVIVSWNTRDYLRSCLQSLETAGVTETAEIVVVDNASSDGSQEMIKSQFPFVSLQALDRNVGFAAANNRAMRFAKTPYILLLNPDAEVVGQAVQELVSFMDRRPEVWAAGPLFLNSDRTPQRTGVRFPSVWNLIVETLFLDRLFARSRLFGRHKELYVDDTRPRAVDYVQGACLIVRSYMVLPNVGLLDDKYFVYFEETDWCYRMKKIGGQVWICPYATVVHHGGGAEGHFDRKRVIYYHQGLFRYARKHCSLLKRGAIRVVIFMRSLLRIFTWGATIVIRPSMRKMAFSTLRGYLRVLPLCFVPVAKREEEHPPS